MCSDSAVTVSSRWHGRDLKSLFLSDAERSELLAEFDQVVAGWRSS